MNFAKLEKSPRLQRVLALLQDGGKHTTRDIVINADVMAVPACVAELREQGYRIDCNRKGKVWEYELLPF